MIVIYKELKQRFDQHVRFWLLSHFSYILDPLLADAGELALLILVWVCTYFVYSDSKGPGQSAHLQDSSEPSFLDTAMSTSIKSNVLAHLIYSLLLVIIY